MAASKHMVAFDCGNSSYRVVLGTYDGERITMDVISQVPNEMIEIGGKFYWDFLSIFQNLKRGLQEVARRGLSGMASYRVRTASGIRPWHMKRPTT